MNPSSAEDPPVTLSQRRTCRTIRPKCRNSEGYRGFGKERHNSLQPARLFHLGFAIGARIATQEGVSAERITELEAQLAAAQASVATLTLANARLTASLAEAEVSLKRSRRNARQDGNALRDEISNLQRRRD